MDYRKMYDDKDYLYAFDLEGCPLGKDGKPERTLEIAGCSRVELTGENNKKAKKPGVLFRDEAKRLALNKTNGKTIAKLYGKETEDWVGELITIFATTTEFGGETRDCIRVRPYRPERSERPANKGNGNSRQPSQGKRTTPSAGQHLLSLYAACPSEERLAELKVMRGQHWEQFDAATREAVGAAALAAKARIDSAAAAGSAAGAAHQDNPPAPPIDEDEAAELVRQDREAAARGE